MLGPGRKPLAHSGPDLDPGSQTVLAAVESGESHLRRGRRRQPELSGPAAAAALARLELLGYLTCSNLGTYSRTLLSPPTLSPL